MGIDIIRIDLMAKIDIDVNRDGGRKRPDNLRNNRPNLSYEEDRERRFRQRMNGGRGQEVAFYDEESVESHKDDKPRRKKHRKNRTNKANNISFLDRYGSIFMRKEEDDDDRISSGDSDNSALKLVIGVAGIIILMGIIMFVAGKIGNSRREKAAAEERARQEAAYEASLNATISANSAPVSTPVEVAPSNEYGLFPGYTLNSEGSAYIGSENMMSEYAIIVDAGTGKVIAEKNGSSIVSPASMTKMMTLLVAVENIPADKLDDKVTVTIEDTDYAYRNDLSSAGYEADEVTTVRDLMYGTILPSGGEASHALAVYVSGSEEAFVELMNKKATELGLSNTHFTNVSGFYDDNHYSTVSEVAIIIKACMENELCRTVMSAHIYTTTPSAQHENGLELSNWFLRRIEDKYSAGLVYAAKTGYVVKAGNCCASFNQMPSGNQYICVTVNAHSAWRCIFDHVDIYETYAK